MELQISEAQNKVPHAITLKERKELEKYELSRKKHFYALKPKLRTYDYISNGRLTVQIGQRFRDTNNHPIESRIGDMLISLYDLSEVYRLNKIAAEEAERKRNEEKRQRELKEKLFNEEIDKFNQLKAEADDFETACKIRKYASAILADPTSTDERIKWAEWAIKKADWLDPTIDAM